MASIFTYDPDLPRVSSPWLTPSEAVKPPTPGSHSQPEFSVPTPPLSLLADYGVDRLEAEPQEGPTEYKLHLLLRPRRIYSSSTTGLSTPGSSHPKIPQVDQSVKESGPILPRSYQARQSRLEQLTTQLLWRLQQSSPYHASRKSDLVLPKLPEVNPSLDTPTRPEKLAAGLEQSRGALYEIGVADDGSFVGLTQDEMNESLTNLRAMAASLGCNVEVLRMVIVGRCEWKESTDTDQTGLNGTLVKIKQSRSPGLNPKLLYHQADLWVAEALVTPDLSSKMGDVLWTEAAGIPKNGVGNKIVKHSVQSQIIPKPSESTEQLRITLTGPTTSGKSSLLGTLTTATLDNGRGKSRLSLLKHRHEIVSGVTSSVAQELLGYKGFEVINYASGNVGSWTDVHASAEQGRLVFVSDSAGHPRYRRTTVRGLVGWAPHWTVLCIAADDGENAPAAVGGTSPVQELLGPYCTNIDLANAHLELCLKLDNPLAIVITKLDLASKTSLRQTLSKILSAIKAVGRVPSILPPDSAKNIVESDLTTLIAADQNAVSNALDSLNKSGDLKSIIPIVMTSAAKGTGIRMMHALLQGLPLPPTPTPHDFIGAALNPEQPASLFHIEDIFGVPASYEPLVSNNANKADSGSVVAGHLRFGSLSVGDKVVLGPFPADSGDNDSPSSHSGARSSPASFGNSLSVPSSTELARMASRNAASASVMRGEWFDAHIVSIRNLRLPVHTLEAGQVGTIGIVFDLPDEQASTPRIRKGMVMAIPNQHMIETEHALQAANGFTASFDDGDINSVTPGSLVVVYVASVRATARVLRLTPQIPDEDNDMTGFEELGGVFGMSDGLNKDSEADPPVFGTDGVTDVKFELITNREWIELGSQVLVMPGGGHGLYYGSERGEKGVAGLEGFVGKVIEVVD
ncbi:hypothetical protein B7463_g4334, partial [Scytalidium lignicola]